jgi:hypothetical protein
MPIRERRRRKLTVLAGMRRQIQKLGPYASMALLAVRLMLVEPLKLVALIVAGKGHWLAGTWMIVAAYAGSLLIVERLFRTVKPKLMLINWFATFWVWFVGLRHKVIASVRRTVFEGWQKSEPSRNAL